MPTGKPVGFSACKRGIYMSIHSANVNNIRPSIVPTFAGSSPAQSGKALPPSADATASIAPAKTAGTVNNDTAINSSRAVANNPVIPINKASETDVSAEEDAKTQSEKALEQAVETANEFVQTVQRDLHFSIDQESERTVVKVIESSSGDIIRQIPDESFLELARKMKESGEVTLVNATG